MDTSNEAQAPGWTWLTINLSIDDHLLLPEIGPAGLTREEARGYIQAHLDSVPGGQMTASQWRAGPVDDTVAARTNHGMMVWAVLEHDGDPMSAAWAWIEDWAQTLRAAGVDVQLAKH